MKANICGKKVRELRDKDDLDQVDISAELSVSHNITISQSDISEIERQVRGVKDFELLALSKVFNVTIYDLLEDQ